jgi:hypothetical protein
MVGLGHEPVISGRHHAQKSLLPEASRMFEGIEVTGVPTTVL